MAKETCSTCGNQYDPDNLQETHPYRHPVNGPLTELTELSQQDAEVESNSLSLPYDPVLRFLLINKGIIEVSEIESTEAQLKAMGFVIANPKKGKGNDQEQGNGNGQDNGNEEEEPEEPDEDMVPDLELEPEEDDIKASGEEE